MQVRIFRSQFLRDRDIPTPKTRRGHRFEVFPSNQTMLHPRWIRGGNQPQYRRVEKFLARVVHVLFVSQ